MWCKVTTAKLKLKNKFFISIGACSIGDSDPNRGIDLRSKSAHPPPKPPPTRACSVCQLQPKYLAIPKKIKLRWRTWCMWPFPGIVFY